MIKSVMHLVCKDHERNICIAFAIDHALRCKEDWVLSLIDNRNLLSGIGGDPGWSIDRRKPGERFDEETASWPSWASVRVFVDPDFISNASNEDFLTDEQFIAWLRRFYVGFGLSQQSLDRVLELNQNR